MSICLWGLRQPINLTCSSDRRRWRIKRPHFIRFRFIPPFWRPLVFRSDILFCRTSPVGLAPPDVWISLFKWQGRPREMATGPALPRIQRPVREAMRACGGEITCAGQSPEPRDSLTGLLTGTRRGKSLYRQRDHGRRNLPLSRGHWGLKPGLLW